MLGIMDVDDILVPAVIVPVAIVVVLLIGVGVAVFTIMMGKKKGRSLDAWARGAYSIFTGGEDSASWAPERAQNAFRDWYGAPSGGMAQNVIEELINGQTGNEAWDKVRALDLVRMALAARYIDQDQSKTYEARIGQALRRSRDFLAADCRRGQRAHNSPPGPGRRAGQPPTRRVARRYRPWNAPVAASLHASRADPALQGPPLHNARCICSDGAKGGRHGQPP